MAKTYEQAKRELLPDSGRWQDRYSSSAGYEEALRDLDREYGKAPKYFIGQGSGGGTSSNLLSAPDNRIYKLGIGGLEGYPEYFLKRGKEFIPFFGEPTQFGEVFEVEGGSAAAVNQIGGGIVPLSTAIQYPEYRALSQADKATPQQQQQVANVTPATEAAAAAAGTRTVGQPSPITIGGGTLTPGTSLGAGGAILGPGSSAVVNGQQTSNPWLNLAHQVQQAIVAGESIENIKKRLGLTGEQVGILSAPDYSGNYYGAGVTSSPSLLPPTTVAPPSVPAPTPVTPPVTPAPSAPTMPEAPGGYNLQAALDVIKNSGLPADVQSLFSEVVKNWKPDQEINMENVLTEFKKIKSSTIDPYFQELTNIAIDEVQRAQKFTVQERGREIEAERLAEREAIRGTQAGLEARGMTFSGEAIKEIGEEAAYTPSMPGVVGQQITPQEKTSIAQKLKISPEELDKLRSRGGGGVMPSNIDEINKQLAEKGLGSVRIQEGIDWNRGERSLIYTDAEGKTHNLTGTSGAGVPGGQGRPGEQIPGINIPDANGNMIIQPPTRQSRQPGQKGAPLAPAPDYQTMPWTPEGRIQRGSRLMASSSEARYRQQREAAQRAAEQYFGSAGLGAAGGLFPEVTPLGGVAGQLPRAQQEAYAGALSGIAGQARQNVAYQQPLNFNFGT